MACVGALTVLLLVSCLTTAVAASAGGIKVCLPRTEGNAIRTPKQGKCRKGYEAMSPSRATAGTLTPAVGDISGFAGRKIPLSLADRQLPAGPRAILHTVRGAAARFSRGRGMGAEVLTIAAWRTRARRVAVDAAGHWRSALSHRHPGGLALGSGGFSIRSGGPRRPSLAVFAEGPVVVEVRFDSAGSGSAVDSFVGAEAANEDILASSARPSTPFERLASAVASQHGPTLANALEAFALLGGRAPGVPPPLKHAGAIGGTQALGWVLEQYNNFSPAQRKAVDAYRAQLTVGVHASSAAGHPAGRGTARAAAVSAAEYQKIADTMRKDIEAHLGPLGYPAVVVKSLTRGSPDPNSPIYAVTDTSFSFLTPTECTIKVYTETDGLSADGKNQTIAHELGHCFQHKYAGRLAVDTGGWDEAVKEGVPEWIGDVVAIPPSPATTTESWYTDIFVNWDREPGPLSARGRDAAGFLGHVADEAGEAEVWSRLPQVMSKKTLDVEAIVQSNAVEVYNDWGSSLGGRPDLGAQWSRTSPFVTPAAVGKKVFRHPYKSELVGNSPESLPAPSLDGALYDINATLPFLRIAPSGNQTFGRFIDQARFGFTLNGASGQLYCTRADCSKCPAGTQGTPPPSKPLSMPLYAGLSAGDAGTPGAAVITPEDWSKYCHPEAPTAPRHAPGVSNGDPYITTFDNGHYGFQTAGEFTLVKSTVDNLEIQSRQVPYPSALYPYWAHSLAMNTAFAMRDGGAIVEVDKGSPLMLYIDRHKRPTHSGEVIALPGGGAVRYSPTGVTVSWADGTTATVLSIGNEGVNIFVNPSASRAGRLRGLMGSDDGTTADDFIGRDGQRYDPNVIQSVGLFAVTRAQIGIVLGGFGRSWRITQAASLFVYPPGKNTRSYLVSGFPRTLLSVQSLTPARSRAAERACRRAGVTNAALLAGCEIDYGVTGDGRLAAATGRVQRAASIPSPTAGGGLSGRWSGHYNGAYDGTFVLIWTQSGSNLSGTIKLSTPNVTLGIDGTVSGETIRFGTVGSVAITYSGSVSRNSMSGQYQTPTGGGSWSATKSS
jgi:hypothetical protein